jgi:LmbE family N-acetylglucosaminyl deacetylase
MRILAVGAHPDDIEFGCGGTLLKYAKIGAKIFLLILTTGEIGGNSKVRKKEQQKAARLLRVQKIFWGGLPDTKIPEDKKVINIIERASKETKPELIFLNYFNDIHQDHRVVASCSIAATRYIKKVLFYEVPTSHNFEPDIFVDITDVLKEKLALLKAHASQVDKTRVPKLTILESARSCANFRGFQARVKYAEGFKPLRLLLDI